MGFQGMGAAFEVNGVVREKRELKSAKNAEWRGYTVKLATFGACVEVNVSAELYAVTIPDENTLVRCVGRLEEQQGRLKAVADSIRITPVKAAS